MGRAAALGLLAAAIAGGAEAGEAITLRAFVGDIGEQQFVTFEGEFREAGTRGNVTFWGCRLDCDGAPVDARVTATSTADGNGMRWQYRIENREPHTTICQVTFPHTEGVRFGESWEGNRVIWPSLAQGAVIDDMTSAEAFSEQCKVACKGVPYLYGKHVGDLCVPFFVHEGPAGAFSLLVLDPTHEVFTLQGTRHETGMTYSATVYPRIPSGESWRFGDVHVIQSEKAGWRAVADRYRQWLIDQGLGPSEPRRGDVASISYGRWDRALEPEEVLRWAEALGIRDVCLWLHLYGRGDQYYPAYFPTPEHGIDGMKAYLATLREGGLEPYFYTNGYLLSPLQTPTDVKEWEERYPEQYPAWLKDEGYADTVAAYRAAGNEFAGEWLQKPGGILPLRVRRVDFKWGEFPVYLWHGRPFWAACVAGAEWRKLFRDTTRLHGQLGCGGIFIDQVAAIHPELCSAEGHGHDGDSFGCWNRAYLRLLEEVRAGGDALRPGFFIEVEGGSALFATYCDRYISWGWANGPQSFPELLRYAAPWTRTYVEELPLGDAEKATRIIERTLMLGGVFRVAVGEAEGPDDPALTGEAATLIRAAVGVRRELAGFYDYGRYMDTIGLTATGCEATWFQAKDGTVLIAARAKEAGGEVRLDRAPEDGVGRVMRLDWRTGRDAEVEAQWREGWLVVGGLPEGLSLVRVVGRASYAG